jgi:threonine dehydrogenase-like Zn-dependent dehydrogenase
MRATCWTGRQSVSVETVPDPRILNSHDAIVKITSTAICGSDLHLYNGFIPTMRRGDILGHEFMGEVVEVGPGVRNLAVGDRVVVPFPIACGACGACERGLTSLCENSNPNAGVAEKLLGHSPAGLFGFPHMLGGFAGGQAEYARVPFADVGPLKVGDMRDEQVLFLSDIFPTGYMGADMADVRAGDVVAVWGAGPVGQFAVASAFLLGAERVIVIDRFDDRLELARRHTGAETLDYEQVSVPGALKEMTGGRGPDKCIDAVGLEGHHSSGALHAYDRAKQASLLETDRPHALREAVLSCANGGTVSVIGVYSGLVDKFPMGAVMNRYLTLRAGQCHVHRYMPKLLEHVRAGDIDPSFVITHRMPLEDAPRGYRMFLDKEDHCEKVVLTP